MPAHLIRPCSSAPAATRLPPRQIAAYLAAGWVVIIPGRGNVLRIAAFACLVLVAVGTQIASACSVPRIRTLDNQTVDGFMAARSGKPCGIVLRRSPGPIDRAEIAGRPSNGTVQISATNRIVYRSRPGFIGSDSFTYVRRGLDARNSAVTRTVRIAVTVR
jgi:hypothetical protein